MATDTAPALPATETMTDVECVMILTTAARQGAWWRWVGDHNSPSIATVPRLIDICDSVADGNSSPAACHWRLMSCGERAAAVTAARDAVILADAGRLMGGEDDD